MDSDCLNIFKNHIRTWKSFPIPSFYVVENSYVVKDDITSNIELWVVLYNSPRFEEILTAVDLNLKNPNVTKINILLEKNSKIKIQPSIAFDPKVGISMLKKSTRAKYSDIIESIPTSSQNINIILNSDIVLSYDNLYKLQNLQDNELAVFTRHEIDKDANTIADFVKTGTLLNNCTSSDAWAFKGVPNIVGDVYMGIPGCDSMFIVEFIKKNFKVYNCGDIIPAYHFHKHKTYATNVFPFTYFLCKDFALTFVKNKTSDLSEESVNTKLLNFAELFNKEFKEYNTLVDIYDKSIEIEVGNFQRESINNAKQEISDKVAILYENELKIKLQLLDSKLVLEEAKLKEKMSQELDEKFHNEYILKTDRLNEQLDQERTQIIERLNENLAMERVEFIKQLEKTQDTIIEEYKSSKFKEIDDELNQKKKSSNEKILQEITIFSEEHYKKLALIIEEQNRNFAEKEEELKKKYELTIKSLKKDADIIKSQIIELNQEEEFLRKRNEEFLIKIDEDCEELRKQRTKEIEESLLSVGLKLISEEEFLQNRILQNNYEIDNCMKLCVLENIEEIKNLKKEHDKEKFDLEAKHKSLISELVANHENFIMQNKNREDELNNNFKGTIEKMKIEIEELKKLKVDELNYEISVEREDSKTKLLEELKRDKKVLQEEFDNFNREIAEKTRLIVLEMEKYKKDENEKTKKLIQEYAEKCKVIADEKAEKYFLRQQEIKDKKIQEYESSKSIEISNNLQHYQKLHDEYLTDYIMNIENKMKDEYSKLRIEQENAIKSWNLQYKNEQLKLDNLRVEKNEFLKLFSENTNLAIADSNQKIKENIEIFNSDYTNKLVKLKEKLEGDKVKTLLQYQEFYAKETEKLQKQIKEKTLEFERKEKEHDNELMKIYSNKKSEIESQIETLRSESLIKMISETNEKRELLNCELDDELKTFRETQITDIRKEIETNAMNNFEKILNDRDVEDLKAREDERRQFKEYIENLRQTEIENIQKSKEATIGRLDSRITEMRKELFELEKVRIAKE